MKCIGVKDKLIKLISEQDKLLDFMDKYNITALMYATEEQLREYIVEMDKTIDVQ